MSAPSFPVGTAVRLAPHATFTRLPFGGAVLIDGGSLALAECGERDGDIIDRLLTHGFPGPNAGPAVQRLVQQMVDAGWFVTFPDSDRRR